MAIQRRRHLNLYLRMKRKQFLDEARQIPLQVHPERKKVRDNDYAPNSTRCQTIQGPPQIRLAGFQKCRLDGFIPGAAREFRGHSPHRIVCGFDARSVPEHYVPRTLHVSTAGAGISGTYPVKKS